jgi:cytochrome c6
MNQTKPVTAILALSIVCVILATPGFAAQLKGETEFKMHCAACHPNGGNIVKPDKTLSHKDLQKSGIKTADDIVKLIRKPGSSMPAFDKKAISDKDARKIAEYVIKSFK